MVSVPTISKSHFGEAMKDGSIIFLELFEHLTQSLIYHSTVIEALFLKYLQVNFTDLVIWYFCLLFVFVAIPTCCLMGKNCKFCGSQDRAEEQFLSYRKIENPSSEVEELERGEKEGNIGQMWASPSLGAESVVVCT